MKLQGFLKTCTDLQEFGFAGWISRGSLLQQNGLDSLIKYHNIIKKSNIFIQIKKNKQHIKHYYA